MLKKPKRQTTGPVSIDFLLLFIRNSKGNESGGPIDYCLQISLLSIAFNKEFARSEAHDPCPILFYHFE